MTPLTLDELVDRCRYWQRVLRLNDWDIEVSLVRREQTNGGLANCSISVYRRARIKIADPIDWTEDDWSVDRDLELSLVHELIHLHFHDLGVKGEVGGVRTPEDVAQERAVEALAQCLLALERRSVNVTN